MPFCPGPPNRVPSDSEKHLRIHVIPHNVTPRVACWHGSQPNSHKKECVLRRPPIRGWKTNCGFIRHPMRTGKDSVTLQICTFGSFCVCFSYLFLLDFRWPSCHNVGLNPNGNKVACFGSCVLEQDLSYPWIASLQGRQMVTRVGRQMVTRVGRQMVTRVGRQMVTREGSALST